MAKKRKPQLPRVIEAKDIVIVRDRSEKPTMDKLRRDLKMGLFTDFVNTELASINPSLNLHSSVYHRRIADLVSSIETPNHPPYALMIRRAIEELNEKGGSSEKAIMEFIMKEYENLPLAHEAILRHHLMKLCEKQELWLKDNDRYILQKDDSVEKRPTKRKKVQRNGKERSEDDKDGEETYGRDFGEGNRMTGHEMEGIYENGTEEELGKGTEERSEVGIEETAVSGAHMASKNMLGNGASDKALVREFDKPDAIQSLRNKEHAEETEPVKDQKVVISEIVEEQLQLEGVQTKVTKEQLSQLTEHQGTEKQCQLRDYKRTRDMEKNSEAELPSVIHQHQNEPSLKRCRTQGSPAKPKSNVEEMLQGETKLSLPPQESENRTWLQWTIIPPRYGGSPVSDSAAPTRTLSAVPQPQNEQQRKAIPLRICRSNRKESSVSNSASPTPTISCVSRKTQAQHKVLGKRRGRPPKPKPDMEQPPKKRGRGRPPKPKPKADAAITVLTKAVTMASFSNSFLQKKLMTEKAKGRGRPRKPKPDQGASRSLEQTRKAGRGRPPKAKLDSSPM